MVVIFHNLIFPSTVSVAAKNSNGSRNFAGQSPVCPRFVRRFPTHGFIPQTGLPVMLAFDLKRGVDLRKVFPNLFQDPPILNRGLIKEKFFFEGGFFFPG